MWCLLLIIVLLLVILFVDRKETFSDCDTSAPNVEPSEWYIPADYEPDDWISPMYPDRWCPDDNYKALSFRHWII